jgi:hypothetical protein
MKDESQDAPERNSRGAVWVWLCWLGVIVLVYVLSIGPVMVLWDKKLIANGNSAAQVLKIVYGPVEWAYAKTLLHKPIGMYYHLWVPSVIDSQGNIIVK